MKRRNTPTARLAAVRTDMAHTPTDDIGTRASAALAVAGGSALMRPPPRLRWRGIEVSDEFQEYAARVARGEDLAPYRGPVLSRPCAEFPWTIAPREIQMLPPERTSLPPERSSLAPERLSLPPMAVPVSAPPPSEPPVYPERGRALKTSLWVLAALSSIVGALGVGAGATNTANNDFSDLIPDRNKPFNPPTPALAPDEPLASRLDEPELEASIGERQLHSLAAQDDLANPEPTRTQPPNPPPPARALPQPAPLLPARAPLSAPPTSPAAPPISSAPAHAAPTNAAPASRLTIPPPAPIPGAAEIQRGVLTTARPVDPTAALAAGADSLFSDRAPF